MVSARISAGSVGASVAALLGCRRADDVDEDVLEPLRSGFTSTTRPLDAYTSSIKRLELMVARAAHDHQVVAREHRLDAELTGAGSRRASSPAIVTSTSAAVVGA